MNPQADWIDKYKRALLERNPLLQASCIEDARTSMNSRMKELGNSCPESRIIERALEILATVIRQRSYTRNGPLWRGHHS